MTPPDHSPFTLTDDGPAPRPALVMVWDTRDWRWVSRGDDDATLLGDRGRVVAKSLCEVAGLVVKCRILNQPVLFDPCAGLTPAEWTERELDELLEQVRKAV